MMTVIMLQGGLFSLMEDPASCPALDHQWRDSSVHNIIMNTLGVDSRVLVSIIRQHSDQLSSTNHCFSLMARAGEAACPSMLLRMQQH